MLILCLVMHVLCVYVSKLLSGFLGEGLFLLVNTAQVDYFDYNRTA